MLAMGASQSGKILCYPPYIFLSQLSFLQFLNHAPAKDAALSFVSLFGCFLQGRLDIESQCRGFLDIAKLATEKLVDAVFKEQAFLDLFHKLYHTPEWEEGSTTSSILATLNDYFHDYERYIDPSNYKRCTLPVRPDPIQAKLSLSLTSASTGKRALNT